MDQICNLIGQEAIEVLTKVEVTTINHLLNTNSKSLEELTDFSKELVQKIKTIATEDKLKNKICTADQIPVWERLSTGCLNIDCILNGGIPLNGILEIYGCSGVGKTQLCLHLALQIQMPETFGGKGKEVIFICTEDVFPSKRLNQLTNAWRNKYNIKTKFEDHIYIQHIVDSVQLQKCFANQLPYLMAQRNIGLIIIDSIAGIFRSENQNLNYVIRSHEFRAISKALNSLQDKFNCGILVTNQVSDNIITGISEPCLGLAWSNNVTSRFCLSRNNDNPLRKFEVIFSPDLPTKCTNIFINQEGIANS